ncbi:MAG: carboxypeptidase regulatory-like domain-containing protein [Acidobacteria bacterium]|nr:carboxypeptidase regulatory-like domain-containing protein [Acidobacteriota bacterium]
MYCSFIKSLFTFLLLVAMVSVGLAQAENNPPPLKRVTLYKHGVGYFERQGKVNGDQQVTFLFDAAQMNDVLKSLVVLDLGSQQTGGKISSVTFDSTKPFDKRIEEFGIRLDASNAAGLTSLLGQLKGARVEVRTGATPIIGTVVGIEKRVKVQAMERSEVQELVLIGEGGELRSIALDQIRGIKLLDTKVREDLEQYLSILQSTIHKNLRKLTISTTGTGERDLFVSYVVEAPVWKTTYRVVLDAKAKPFLQGWALVDNVQDEDWTNVTLSLVAGAPVSFIQDLQQPRYKQRPVVEMPDDLSVAPQIAEAPINGRLELVAGGGTLEGIVRDANGSVLANATVRVTQLRSGAEITANTDYAGRYKLRGLAPGRYKIEVYSTGFKSTVLDGVNLASGAVRQNNVTLEVGGVSETVTVTASAERLNTERSSISYSSAIREKDLGVDADVETQDIGELFEYRIAHPVTIRRNSSALIPILQNSIEGETVSLYNRSTREQNPMSALYLTNTSGLTLESGPVTIIENDTYAGEALTARIKPNEKRFITYAIDLGCRVSVKEDEANERATMAQFINGEMRVHYKQSKATTYTLTNLTDRAKTVYVEHAYDKDSNWQLVKTVKPAETTDNFYRFKVAVPPNASTQLIVTEELPDITNFTISNVTTNDIEIYAKANYLTPQMKQALESVVETKMQISSLNRQIAEKRLEITSIMRDQERMRDNLKAMGKSEEEKQLVQRYVSKIAQGEDQLERLRAEEKKLTEEKDSRQNQLEDRIRKLAMEHRLN